ncbi:MAG: IS30 family transposase [Clostridia bacterium]|nr:IS30 family transposase [Clostridia bacterium]
MKRKELTERERYLIEIYLSEKYNITQIARKMNRDRSTISKEIKRGRVEQYIHNYDAKPTYVYKADYAHEQYHIRQSEKGRPLKIGNDIHFIKHCEKMIIKHKWSPDAIIGRLKNHGNPFKTNICTVTLYNYIDRGILLNVSNKNLPVKRNKQKQKYERIRKVALKNLKGTSIEKRDRDILNRNDFGHWEMDCVCGKQTTRSTILVLTERKYRIEITRKMKSKTTKEVVKQLNSIERQLTLRGFRNIFQTITCDNGCEFLDEHSMKHSFRSKQLRTRIYYCHPYASCERGSNENQNKLVRYFVPKGTNIEPYTSDQIKQIGDWMNNYPRRMFGYKTPLEMMQEDNINIPIV